MTSFAVVIEGMKNIEDLSQYGEKALINQVRAANTAVARGRTLAARIMGEEINFPRGYLDPGGKKLFVAKQATRNDPQAIIRATGRPTSLARYVESGEVNKKGVVLRVDPNKSSSIKSAFLIRLPAGKAPIDTKSNLGLAIRLKPGEKITNKRQMIQLARGLYLLYGPAVDQVFMAATGARAGQGTITQIEEPILDFMEQEFFRLMGVL